LSQDYIINKDINSRFFPISILLFPFPSMPPRRPPQEEATSDAELHSPNIPHANTLTGGDAGQASSLLGDQPIRWRPLEEEKLTTSLLTKIAAKISLFNREREGKRELLAALGEAQQSMLELLQEVTRPTGGFYAPHEAFEALSYEDLLATLHRALEKERDPTRIVLNILEALVRTDNAPDRVAKSLQPVRDLPQVKGEELAKAILISKLPLEVRTTSLSSVGDNFDMLTANAKQLYNLQQRGQTGKRPSDYIDKGRVVRPRGPSLPFCTFCHKRGHLVDACYAKNPSLRPAAPHVRPGPAVSRVNIVEVPAANPEAQTGQVATTQAPA